MTDREKLFELLGADTCKANCEDCEYCANPEACIEYLKTSLADHLLANGVTIPVRCEECEKWKEPWLEGQHLGQCMKGKTAMTKPDGFCSDGERRTDG